MARTKAPQSTFHSKIDSAKRYRHWTDRNMSSGSTYLSKEEMIERGWEPDGIPYLGTMIPIDTHFVYLFGTDAALLIETLTYVEDCKKAHGKIINNGWFQISTNDITKLCGLRKADQDNAFTKIRKKCESIGCDQIIEVQTLQEGADEFFVKLNDTEMFELFGYTEEGQIV